MLVFIYQDKVLVTLCPLYDFTQCTILGNPQTETFWNVLVIYPGSQSTQTSGHWNDSEFWVEPSMLRRDAQDCMCIHPVFTEELETMSTVPSPSLMCEHPCSLQCLTPFSVITLVYLLPPHQLFSPNKGYFHCFQKPKFIKVPMVLTVTALSQPSLTTLISILSHYLLWGEVGWAYFKGTIH